MAFAFHIDTTPDMQVWRAAQQVGQGYPAAQQIGHVPGLIAAVVEQIECAADLARAQQVSKSWNHEITRSQFCQERLFQRPVTDRELVSVVESPHTLTSAWTMLRRVSASTERHCLEEGLVAVHPLIVQSLMSGRWAGGDVDFDTLLSWASGPLLDMFITQPPVTRAYLTMHYTFDDGPYLHEPMTVTYQAIIDDEEPVDFRRVVKELKATCYVADIEFWTWLPEAYHLKARGKPKPKISLDDYIASYAFPRPSKATIELKFHISSASNKYMRLRGQPLRPHPGKRKGDGEDDVLFRYSALH